VPKSGEGNGAAIDVVCVSDLSRLSSLRFRHTDDPRAEGGSPSNDCEEKCMLTSSERAKIAEQFPEHVARMRSCLQSVGRAASDSDLTLAWASYSDSLCASWLEPPESDTALTEILLSYLAAAGSPTEAPFHMALEDAGDETGDAFVALPPALLDRLGWKIGDTLSINEDSRGSLRLRRV
jgi:hypothetical protein